jgi:hypothetical protein
MSHGALVASAAATGVNHISSASPMVWQNFVGNGRLTAAEKEAIKNATPNKSASWYKSQERLFRKQRTLKFVNEEFGLKISDDDIGDAIALGYYGLANWNKLF